MKSHMFRIQWKKPKTLLFKNRGKNKTKIGRHVRFIRFYERKYYIFSRSYTELSFHKLVLANG